MGFSEFPNYPTRYRLGLTWLYLTNWDYPVLRRGTKAVETIFYQPSDMYEELEPLVDAGETTLTIFDADRDGNMRETVIGGLIVKKVRWLHDGIDGCQVIISDVRDLIDNDPWPYDVNLLVYGQIVPNTAAVGSVVSGIPQSLFDLFSKKLFETAPFKGRMADGWQLVLKGKHVVPFDSKLTGGTRSEVLQKLLEQWSLDFALDTDGKFYIADRVIDAAGDRGVEQLKGLDMEWEAPGPVFGRRAKTFLRAKKYRMPFYEDHNLQIWYGDPPADDGETSSGPAVKQSGMILQPAYKALGDYFSLGGLLAAAGIDASVTDRNAIRGAFLRTSMRGTILSVHSKDVDTIDSSGNKSFSEQRQIRIAIAKAVVDSERRLFQLRRDPSLGSLSRDRGGPGDWLDIKLNRIRPDGTVAPTRVYGFWTLLYNEPEIVHQPKMTAAQIYIGRVFDDKGIVIDGKIKDPEILKWDPEREDFAGFKKRTEDDPFGEPAAPYRWRLGHACPFTVRWDDDKSNVVRLEKDERDLGELGRAVMGRPDQQYVLKGPELFGQVIPLLRISRRVDPDKNKLSEDNLKDLGLQGQMAVEDLTWFREYSFFIVVNARRNLPNDESKFHIEEIDGFADAPIEEITLLPDDRVTMRRQYADRTGNEGFEAVEDGYGKRMNPKQVKEEAERKVAYVMAAASEPEPVKANFFNINAVKNLKLTGSLDSVILRIRGMRVECELQTGTRVDDNARLIESNLQRQRQMAEYAGKIAKR